VRVAIEEVAPPRGLRVWKSQESGEMTVRKLTGSPEGNVQDWVLDLMEATCDHLDGLRWGAVLGQAHEERLLASAEEHEPEHEPEHEDRPISSAGGFAVPFAPPSLTPVAPTTPEPEHDEHEPEAEPFDGGAIVPDAMIPELPVPDPVPPRAPEIVGALVEDSWLVQLADEIAARLATTPASVSNGDLQERVRERYADGLLAVLQTDGSEVDKGILLRLDRLAGIEVGAE
jgi:hypothetical protein